MSWFRFVDRGDDLGREQTHLSELGGVLGLSGEVVPFVGTGFGVVEFLLAAEAGEAEPALRADGAGGWLVKMGDGGAGLDAAEVRPGAAGGLRAFVSHLSSEFHDWFHASSIGC